MLLLSRLFVPISLPYGVQYNHNICHAKDNAADRGSYLLLFPTVESCTVRYA